MRAISRSGTAVAELQLCAGSVQPLPDEIGRAQTTSSTRTPTSPPAASAPTPGRPEIAPAVSAYTGLNGDVPPPPGVGSHRRAAGRPAGSPVACPMPAARRPAASPPDPAAARSGHARSRTDTVAAAGATLMTGGSTVGRLTVIGGVALAVRLRVRRLELHYRCPVRSDGARRQRPTTLRWPMSVPWNRIHR